LKGKRARAGVGKKANRRGKHRATGRAESVRVGDAKKMVKELRFSKVGCRKRGRGRKEAKGLHSWRKGDKEEKRGMEIAEWAMGQMELEKVENGKQRERAVGNPRTKLSLVDGGECCIANLEDENKRM